jgi:hypothetical protein
MKTYHDEMKIKDALQVYFAKYHFSDGGYNDKYFRIKIGPVFIPVPNTKSRIRAVKFHDIHHILTEYTALWKGEVEIGAWEIAAGCGNSMVAWCLNSGSFGLGLLLYPGALFRAFMKGRNTRTSLYYNYQYNEALLNKTVGQLREELGVTAVKTNSARDHIYFSLWTLILLSVMAGPVIFLLCLLN